MLASTNWLIWGLDMERTPEERPTGKTNHEDDRTKTICVGDANHFFGAMGCICMVLYHGLFWLRPNVPQTFRNMIYPFDGWTPDVPLCLVYTDMLMHAKFPHIWLVIIWKQVSYTTNRWQLYMAFLFILFDLRPIGPHMFCNIVYHVCVYMGILMHEMVCNTHCYL